VPQFFWLWSPVNFADASLFFHINADQAGKPWNSRAVWCPDQAGPAEQIETERASMSLTLTPGWRHASSASLTIEAEGQPTRLVDFQPLATFLMRGLGYGHPTWGHGGWKGELVLEREDIDLSAITPGRPDHLHIQAICNVTLSTDGQTQSGTGILEQFIIGPYAPLGLTSLVAD
jgi:hypothetical protein